MINQPGSETIDSSMTPPPKDVLSYSVSQNPVASELDGDSIDSSIQNALTETASNQSKKTPISIPVQELTPIERAVNEYAKINNARNKTALNQSLVSASAKDPDTAAKSQALATSLNVSTGVVDFDIELAKRQMLLRKAEAIKLAEKYPSLAKMFLNQDFAEIAHDDIDNLAKTSDISRRLIATNNASSDSFPLEFDPIRTANYYATNTLEGFKSDWERGYKSGNITDRSSKLGYSAFTSPGSELRDLYIFQAENLKSKTEEYLGTWTESLAELAGQMTPMTVEATATGVVASGAVALVASIFPPAELPAAPGAFAAGFAGSMSYQSFEIETGASYLDLRKGDEDYEPMSHEEAAAIAPTIGLINAVLETASNFYFFIPGAKLAKYALKKTVKETVSKSLKKATVGKLARSAAVRVLKTGTLETVTEVLQTIVPKIVREANVPEGRMSAFDTEEGRKRFADEIAVTIEKTFKGAFLLGLIPGGAKFIHERSILNESIEQQNDITNLIDNAKESKVNKRSKPTYNSYLAQQLSGESLHIGVDQFEQIRKKSGVSLEELEKIIPGITKQVAEAKASSSDVVIPTSLYLSELIDTEFGVSIRNDIRADAKGKSINDIAEDEISRKEFSKELKQEIEDFKKTNKDWAESAGNIEEEVFAKIKAAGNYTEEQARMLAQWHRDVAVVLASRFEMTPEQFNAKFGLSIESAYTPEQQAPAQGSFGQASRADLGLGQQAAPAPDSGVFDANNPPVSSEAIFALMDADGKIYYDINATMHGDLVETFPDITDTVIDGGFIVNGKYMMGKSDGGYSAFEGEQKQIDAVRNFTEQANTQGFQESNYRPAVVAWAKERFGDRTAPDGSTVWQNFTEWFGDSKVVDAEGNPLVVYHGTDSIVNFTSFKESVTGRYGRGNYFATKPTVAEKFVRDVSDFNKEKKPRIIPVFVSIKKPYVTIKDEFFVENMLKELGLTIEDYYKKAKEIHAKTFTKMDRLKGKSLEEFDDAKPAAITELLQDAGFDGIQVNFGKGDSYFIAFEPAQIKSAIGNTGEFSATDPNMLRQELIEVNHKREKTTGRYVGAPDWIGGDTKKLNVLRKKLKALALEGERGRMWYENSSKAILEITGGDIAEAEKIVSLIAIYSPNATVPANTSMALTAYYQWKAGHKINAGFSASDKKAEELLRNNKPWSGIKTNSFYQNLMVEIDPSRLDTGVATMDMWMAIAFDYGDKALDQGPKYKFSEREMQRLASELGWKPHQVQAAIWTAMKGRVDAIRGELKKQELKLGIGRLVTKTDPITGKESEIYEVIPDKKYEHFKLAHKIAMEYTLTPEDINASKYDFSDAMRERTIQMSWEATPSTSTGRSLPGIHGASLKQKFEYLQAVQDVLTENGRDVIADLAGLPQGTTANGFSAWLGDIGAGAQTFVPVPSSGFGKTRAIKPSAVEILDLASAIRGYVLEQDAIVYHTPVWDDAKIRHNGLQLSASRPLTKEEMQTMYSAIHQKFGTWDLAPGYRPDGARIINFTSIPNAEFQKGMIEVIEALPKLFGGGTIEIRTFRSDGNYISNDWTKDTNGEGYLKRIQTKRPDIQQRVADLRSRVEAVNRKFEAKYGWDKPASGLLKQSEVPATLYSALSVEVGKLTIKSASADSWKQQIKGLIAKGVIKEREVFWSGLDNWLDLQEGKITKEQVQAFLAAGGVKVELTRLEDGGGQGNWTFDGDTYETEQDAEEAADSASVQQAQDRFDGNSSINDSYLLMREGETIETFYDEDEARQALAELQLELEDSENASIEERYEVIIDGNSYGVYGDRIAAQQDANNVINDWADAIRRDMDVSKVDDDDSNASKFSSYQLPDGTNYREVLVTLPRDALGTREIMDGDKVVAIAKNDAFKSSHWDQPNVLVHLRLNDRVDADGKKVLFVEEVQSDWGQAGREKGFVTPIKQEDIDKEETLRNKLLKAKENTSIAKGKVLIEQQRIVEKLGLKDYMDIILAGERRKELTDAYRKLVADDKEYKIAVDKDVLATIEEVRVSTEYSAAVETTRQTDRVPVAPFVESTNGWLELGLKQIMLEAVNGKYDRVAFVDGDQSVERYRKALTEAVDEVEINKNDDATYTYSAIRGGVTVQGEQLVSAKRINEVFGKAGSKQLLEQADANPNDIHTISSKDIEIGGEGMRKFYDTIVPQALNKMLKKLGGDKVETVNMITEKPVTQEQINAAERRRDFTESERLTAIYERQQLGRGISEKGQQQTGEQQGFTVTPALAAQVNQGLPLFQSAQNKPARGWFDPKQLKAMLGSKSDITTFFHELAHYYLTVYSRVASDPQSPSQVREDMDAILSWFGIAGETPEQRLATWNAMTLEEQRPHHEAFAYNKEIYVSEGKSPSIEMQGVFERFGQFIKRIYISIRDDLNAIYKQEFGTDLPMMTGEIRRVMDRMIATDEQIRSAEERRNMENIFKDQELSGMDDAQWASYQQMRAEATQKSVSELNEQSLAATTWASRLKAKKVKELEAEQEELRSEIRKQVKKEVESRNVYRAIKFLKYGILQTAGGEEVEFTGSNKLNTNAVKLMVPKENMDKFGSGKNGMVALDGYHPDIVSERFNYSSGDELILAILDAKPMDEVIDGITEDRMEIENGELNSPQAIEAAADKAVHNEARVKLVAVELRWLTKATQPVRAMIAAAKSVAKQMLETKRLRDIKPGDYASAAARAAKESQTAYFASQSAETAAKTAYTRHYNKMIAEGAEEAKAVEMATKVSDEALAKAESRSEAHKKKYGKMKPSEVAAQAKRSQLLQEQLALEANDAIDQVKKSLKYLRNVLSDKNVQKIGADNSDQIALLLERFELKNISLKEMDKRTSLANWIASQLELGLEVDISKELIEQTNKIPYRNLTLSEFNDLVDAVKTIEYMGKNENAILTAAKKAAFKETKDEIVKSIIENAGDRKASTRTPKSGTIGAVTNQVTRFLGAQFKAASIVRILDGGKDDGPLWNYLIRPANKSGDKETSMKATATEAASKILNPFFKSGRMGGKGKFFVSVNESLNREEKLVIALNMGNEGNIQRMLDGYGWTLEQVIPILESMTAEELNAVQEIWDLFGTYKSEISAMSRKIYGKDLDFIEPTPIQIKSASGETVSLRGGYYPAKYDPMASLAAENYDDAEKGKDLLRAAHISATTSRAYSKQRAEKVVDRPLIRNLSALYSGLNEVIHDLSWREWTIDANKLMRDKAFDKEIRERYGPAFKNQLKSWIKDVAAGEKGMDTDVDIALNFLRQGVSSAGLGFNLMSAALQITGFNQSIIRVGPKYIGYGIMQVMKRGIGAFREVNELSEFMANRSRTQFRELNELRNRVQGQSAAMKRVRMGTYFLMMKMQRSVDVPTWIGAYAKQLEINPDEQLAIDIADQTVIDTQGGGQIKDLSAVERGGAGTKLFTVFYGFMNTVYNMAAVETMTEKKRGKLAAKYVMLFVVPVVLGYALKQLLKPSKDDDDEFDLEQMAKDLSIEQIQYLMGTMVVAREFSQIAKTMIDPSAPSMGYGGPAGVRMIGDTYTAATQIGQGEFDSAFRKSAINLIGDATGLPSAQINRTIDGIEALMEDETTDIRAPLFGVRK